MHIRATPTRATDRASCPARNVHTQTPSTFALQSQLPRLPVLELSYTLPKYLKTIEPFATPEELARTKKWMEDFTKPGGVGEFLQQRLKERDAREKEGSWLSEWWSNWAYLEYRDPVVINVSFFYQFETPSPNVTQVGRCAVTDKTITSRANCF
mgnify:CR=1 FL=1